MATSLNLFLDTNIWLSFYHFSTDDLEELRKLAVLIREKDIKVFLPDQVLDEFRRNREVKISDAFKKFESSTISENFPQICMEYDEKYKLMRKAIREYKDAKVRLSEKLREDFSARRLKADTLISELFSLVKALPISRKMLLRAWERKFRGNPPGKDGSNGDEINWECLLGSVPDGEDLYIIAEDSDYRSKFDDSRFSPVLKWEWRVRKKSQVYFYRKLSSFFKEKHPEIKLASELEKRVLIDKLVSSSSYQRSRTILGKLAKINDLTDAEVEMIAEAATDNEQIWRIGSELDINEYLINILSGHDENLDPTLKTYLVAVFAHIGFDELTGHVVRRVPTKDISESAN
jgi:PIN domain